MKPLLVLVTILFLDLCLSGGCRHQAGQGRSWKSYAPGYPFGQAGDERHPDGYDGFPGDHPDNPFRPSGGPGGNAWPGGNGNGGRGGDGFGPDCTGHR